MGTPVSWKNAKNGTTSVTLHKGEVGEKRFKVQGLAFSAAEVAALCQDATAPVKIRSRRMEQGAVGFTAAAEENGQELADAIRSAAGIEVPADKGKGKSKSKAEERAAQPPASAPATNGTHA